MGNPLISHTIVTVLRSVPNGRSTLINLLFGNTQEADILDFSFNFIEFLPQEIQVLTASISKCAKKTVTVVITSNSFMVVESLCGCNAAGIPNSNNPTFGISTDTIEEPKKQDTVLP